MEQGVSVEGLGVEAEADWDHLRTPETYLDYARRRVPSRSTNHTPTGFPSACAPASEPSPASGRSDPRTSCWTTLAGASPAGCTGGRRVSGKRLRAPSHDVDEDGNGVLEDRLHQLVHQHGTVREQTLEITS